MRSVQNIEQDGRSAGDVDGTGSHGGSNLIGAASATKANILIVDDRPQNLLAMAEMLAPLNENIVRAKSGAEALRCLLRQDVAIILLDVQMPDMDGYELAALLRTRERSSHTPIIFITAFDRDDQEISRGYALGAVDYVFKPIDPVILRTKVSVFVELFKKTEAVREQAKHERRLQLENLRANSEKLQAERALRQIEERQSLIIRSLPIALYTAGLNGRFAGPRFLSGSIASAVGFKAAAFIDDENLWTARIHPDDLPHVLSQAASIVENGTVSMEYRWRCADGSERVFLDQAALVRDETGIAREIVGTCLDITDRIRLEQQLLQAQKMEAIGQLTGGIAHDFNNMLSVIIWNLDMLTRSLKGSGKVYDRVQNALSAALNCAELIRQLLTFARHQPAQPRVIDLFELIPRMARLLGPVFNDKVNIDIRLPHDLWAVSADQAQIESALLNLAINARDAMPNGGTLTIEAANIQHHSVEAESAPGEYVMVAVTDTGVGMPREVADRAFEPFFTTKGPGKGSGLGLSMVYGFLKQSGGQVKIESALGTGTTVRLYLPRAEAPRSVGDRGIAKDDTASAETGRIILVVEDDATVRSMTVARLAELGHRVLEAHSAAAALDILRRDSPIDLLFTDVVMPGGMSGLDLAHHALELRPAIKVLFATGYASSFNPTGGVPGEVLQKPYRDEDLSRALLHAWGDTAAPTASIVEPRSSSATASG